MGSVLMTWSFHPLGLAGVGAGRLGVPEPGALILLGVGMLVLLFARRRHHANRKQKHS